MRSHRADSQQCTGAGGIATMYPGLSHDQVKLVSETLTQLGVNLLILLMQ